MDRTVLQYHNGIAGLFCRPEPRKPQVAALGALRSELPSLLIMYTCAIFYYPKKILNSNVSWILKFNPLFCIINNFRNCVFGRAMSAHMLIYSFTFAFVCIVIGIAVFNKKQDQFILHL